MKKQKRLACSLRRDRDMPGGWSEIEHCKILRRTGKAKYICKKISLHDCDIGNMESRYASFSSAVLGAVLMGASSGMSSHCRA
jgi:hypothetical protein